jgi:CHAD domain-containing protein
MWERVPEWLRLKTVLGEIQRQTNELRDLDVLLLDFPDLQAQLPWEEGTHLEGWKALLVRRRLTEWRRVKAFLESGEYRLMSEEVRLLMDDLKDLGEPLTLGELASFVFEKAASGLHKSLKGLVPDSPDGALHEIRIRTKKLRYALDAFGSLGPVQTVKILTMVLKETQEGLGKFQDRSILLARLKNEWELFRTGQTGLDPLAFGLLVGILVSAHGSQKARAFEDCRQFGSKTFSRALDRLVDVSNGGPSDES